MAVKAKGKEPQWVREVVVPKAIDWEILEQLEIKEDVRAKFADIGWKGFLDWDTTVYADLTREFFNNMEMEVESNGDPRFMTFELEEKSRMTSINELTMGLGMAEFRELMEPEYNNAMKSVPNFSEKKWTAIWVELAKPEEFRSCEQRDQPQEPSPADVPQDPLLQLLRQEGQ